MINPQHTFIEIWHIDDACGARWDCCQQGVVLAYDDFQPEFATWFCAECWEEFEDCPWLIVAEDRREQVGA